MGRFLRRAPAQKTYRGHGAWLRECREWPSNAGTTENDDEIATLHLRPSSGQRPLSLPHHRIRTSLCITAELIVEWLIWVMRVVFAARHQLPLHQPAFERMVAFVG
jgi:hypothetical protein